MSDSTTLIFVPGAWHRPSCYTKVIQGLEARFHLKCVSVSLPSTKGDPNATFKDDLDAARAAITAETTQNRNCVLVAHSYGGMVANSAIKGFTETRAIDTAGGSSSPSAGHVIGLVLIASGFTLTGMAFMDPFFGIPPPAWRVNKDTGFADIVTSPQQFLYHDLPAEEADHWVSQLTTQSLKALFEGGEHGYAGWRDVPAWYIGTVEDQGIPVVAQRLNVGMAREMGTTVEHRELMTSHSPFLSQPDEVVSILVEAVEKFTGKSVQGDRVAVPEGRILKPAVTIWRPYSLVRYGLPLALGHVVGRCLLLFYGARSIWRSVFGAKEKAT